VQRMFKKGHATREMYLVWMHAEERRIYRETSRANRHKPIGYVQEYYDLQHKNKIVGIEPVLSRLVSSPLSTTEDLLYLTEMRNELGKSCDDIVKQARERGLTSASFFKKLFDITNNHEFITQIEQIADNPENDDSDAYMVLADRAPDSLETTKVKTRLQYITQMVHQLVKKGRLQESLRPHTKATHEILAPKGDITYIVKVGPNSFERDIALRDTLERIVGDFASLPRTIAHTKLLLRAGGVQRAVTVQCKTRLRRK
jgi:hypothetical protein